MTIAVGERLPEAQLLEMTEQGPRPVALGELTRGRTVVIFGLPGAFTGTCTNAHVPSFMRNMEALRARGVDEVICVSVNDPFVMGAWGQATGASGAGIRMLADADGSFTRAIGMAFDAPPVGLYGRSQRYALLARDGVVEILNHEPDAGVCDLSAGEAMVAALDARG
ncbi:MAG: peroxiredoxin [Alphaproteobacteria bacterium]|nr:MAG: peroxiredoxin [Alphaproteobacteria bacterium]